jgi:hypothetical protein
MNEVKISDTVATEKDIRINLLEKEIAKNTFDNKQIFKEASTIFPGLTSLSLANHSFYSDKDSSYTTPVLIYGAKKELNKEDKLKLVNWLKQRLALSSAEVYKK